MFLRDHIINMQRFHFKKEIKSKGFTLVETLVAIAILMIAIAGPLSVANKSLTAALYARDQLIASYLAQEATEVIYNIRDNNIKTGASFLDGLSPCFGNSSSPSYCDVTASNPASLIYKGSAIDCTNGCQLYLNTNNEYVSQSLGTKTPFRRYFYIEALDPGEARLTVIVTWNAGGVPNQIKVVTQLFDLSDSGLI